MDSSQRTGVPTSSQVPPYPQFAESSQVPSPSQPNRYDEPDPVLPTPQSLPRISPVTVPESPCSHTVQTCTETGCITSASPRAGAISNLSLGTPPLALPSLCHPHIHLDKPYLLTHPHTEHLQPDRDTFKDAMETTSKAKSEYTPTTLRERGNQLLAASSRAGVTHARAFVEVDPTVGMMCLESGVRLKNLWREHMDIQICAFAQEPLVSGSDPAGMQELMETAAGDPSVGAVGSTPYVEANDEAAQKNIEHTIGLAIRHGKHLDFHLDYHLTPSRKALVWHVLRELRNQKWTTHMIGFTVCLGHCTRLTLFGREEWRRLRHEVRGLPVYFVGLPTSDLFLAKRREDPLSSAPGLEWPEKLADMAHNRGRGTLQLPIMQRLGFRCALGVNNVGNAFTPWGTADPLSLASLGVGLYQMGSKDAAEGLYELVSSRAKEAIGLGPGAEKIDYRPHRSHLKEGDKADMVIFGRLDPEQDEGDVDGPAELRWKTRQFDRPRTSVADVVWDPPTERTTIFRGRVVSFD